MTWTFTSSTSAWISKRHAAHEMNGAPYSRSTVRTDTRNRISELNRVVNLKPTAKGACMHALLIAVLVSVGIGSTVLAQQQQRSVRDMMNEMKARYGQTFDQCQALATSRGYRLSDSEQEGRLVTMFIEGCIMGKQQ